jgi:ABC-type lipoprotein export system ATPase subunit
VTQAVALHDVFCVHRTPDGDAAALQGLTLELGEGEHLCVLGPSGAGKSTLLRVIAGLQTPSAGSVLVFGRDPGRIAPRDRARLRHDWIGFLYQRADATLPPELPIEAAVGLPLALRGVPSATRHDRVDELLNAAGLAERGRALPGQLSGGERQCAALCVALAHRPRLLLADEPTAELDATSAEMVAGLINQLATIDGATVIVVSHDDALAEHAQRALRIRDGRVVENLNGSRGSLVVGAGGWIRLPASLLGQAGIDGSAQAQAVEGGLLLTPSRAPAADGTAAGGRGPEATIGASAAAASTTGGAAEPGPTAEPRAAQAPGRTIGHCSPAAVELHGVSRSRGRGVARVGVLERLSLRFEPGVLTAVTGRSGVGKTTLLELVACLQRPDSGNVVLDGRTLDGLDREQLASVRRERIGYLPQEPAPIGFLTAVENVTLALRLRGCTAAEALGRADAALALVSVSDRSRQRVQRLSAGEVQRVALARALACARGLLVVDEPTSRLDEGNATTVAIALCEAAAEGQTVICATHDPDLIRYADRVVELGA